MPEGSVELVLTDPVYDRIEDYAFLEDWHGLSQAGNGLAFVNAKWLSRVMRAMRTELPVLSYLNGSGAAMNGRVIAKSHHLVWWGSGCVKNYVPDGWLSTSWSKPHTHLHKWRKNPKYLALVVRAFTDASSVVLDPFMGTGQTIEAAKENGCSGIGVELEERYCEVAVKRLDQQVLPFNEGADDTRHSPPVTCHPTLAYEEAA